MKKLKILAVLCCLICTVFGFVGCGDELSAPKGVTVTTEKEVIWSPVKDAYRYLVQMKNKESGKTTERKSQKASIAVSDFELEEGDYEIRVKALSDSGENDSEWSAAYDFEKEYESGCVYTLVNSVEYELTSSGSAKGYVVLEDEYNGKPVTSIADSAFKANTAILGVEVGKYVETIGKNAFYGCSQMKSVTLPETLVSIGENAFQNCRSLEKVTIPDSVTNIGTYAFAYCRSLKEAKLGSNVQALGEYGFYECSALTKINIPNSVTSMGSYAFAGCEEMLTAEVGNGLTEIANRAFYECTKLKSITFKEGIKLQSIGELAFAHIDALTSITIPEGVVDIGSSAFLSCDLLETIDFPTTVEHLGANAFGATKYYVKEIDKDVDLMYIGNWLIYASASYKDTVTEITPSTFKDSTAGIADEVFYKSLMLNTIELNKKLKYIGNYTFAECLKVTSVTTQGAVTIGEYAFLNDNNITSLNLAKGLESIGAYAFMNCSSLENPSSGFSLVPETVTSIGTYAFYNSGLWDNPSEDGIIYAGTWVVGFSGAPTVVNIKANTVGISNYAFYLCTSLQTVSGLTRDVKYIGRGAFYGCIGLGTINLNRNMNKIEDYTFYSCFNLFSVGLPTNLQSIGRSAFYGCQILNELDFSTCRSLESIGDYAFTYCGNLKKIHFGRTLTSIGDYAFYKCSVVEELVFPDSLVSIGDYAFYKCYGSYETTTGEGEDAETSTVYTGLKKIEFGKGLETIGDHAFNGNQLLESVVLPDSVKSVGTSAFYNCVSVKEVSLGNSLVSIGDYAFFGLDKVERLALPQTLKTIGNYAFKGWNGLISIVLPSDVIAIGEHAFYGCNGATVYAAATSDETGWDARWNSSYRPTVWGANLVVDEDSGELYVDSVAVTEETFANLKGEGGFTAPVRAGYEFLGWATSETGAVDYASGEVFKTPAGTTLYARWKEIVAEQPQS
ncbi:MAG: leucine-rich repeat protein [Clostridia bacterium]|nr:leucine-rich repeat protein [Clostridia bacterium]